MPILPSSEQLAENIRKHVDALAAEIAQRVSEDIYTRGMQIPDRDLPSIIANTVHTKAQEVLLDWLLGDLIPEAPK